MSKSSNGSTSYVALFNCYQLCQRAQIRVAANWKNKRLNTVFALNWANTRQRKLRASLHPQRTKKQFTLPVCFGRIAFFEVVFRGENDFFFRWFLLFLIKTLIGHRLLLSWFLGRVYLQGHDRFVIKATDYFNWKYSRVISYRRI